MMRRSRFLDVVPWTPNELDKLALVVENQIIIFQLEIHLWLHKVHPRQKRGFFIGENEMRIQIFVDFWNMQLGWNDLVKTVPPTKIPWKDALPQALVAAVAKGASAEYAGTNVYASIDPQSAKDKGLKNFLRVMDGFPGYSVSIAERKPRKPHACSNEGCRKPIDTCPHCNLALRRTVEKGVDASLITDLLSMAFDDNYDVAVLVTEDADFAPAVKYIQKKTGKRVIQAYFKRHGDELRNACWDHIFLDDLLGTLLPPVSAQPVKPKFAGKPYQA